MSGSPRTWTSTGLHSRSSSIDLSSEPRFWKRFVRHDPSTRHFIQLYRDPHLDLWLICWLDAQDTGYHDHDVSSGAVYVCDGTLHEDHFERTAGRLDARGDARASPGLRVRLRLLVHPRSPPRGWARLPPLSTRIRPRSGAWGTTSSGSPAPSAASRSRTRTSSPQRSRATRPSAQGSAESPDPAARTPAELPVDDVVMPDRADRGRVHVDRDGARDRAPSGGCPSRGTRTTRRRRTRGRAALRRSRALRCEPCPRARARRRTSRSGRGSRCRAVPTRVLSQASESVVRQRSSKEPVPRSLERVELDEAGCGLARAAHSSGDRS